MSDFQRKKTRPWDGIDSLMSNSNQLVTNKEPISNQLVTQEVTNKEPIGNQLVTNKKAIINNKVTNKEPISNPTSNHHRQPISNQLVTPLVTSNEAKNAVKRLCGLQKKILFYVVEQCVNDGHLTSGPITNETFREVANAGAHTVKTAVQRLIHKGLLQRGEGKRGNGGFASFSINKDIRQAVIEQGKQEGISNQLVTPLVTDISNPLVTNKVSHREPTPSSSSSNLNNNTNTTTTELPPEWEEIDLSELHKRNIRFTQNHIIQLWPFLKNHSAFDFQESIDGFVYDLEHGHKTAKNGPLNLFIGAIRGAGVYTSAHYVSPRQQQIQAMLALAQQRKEEAFQAWVETHHAEIEKKVEAHSHGLWMVFKQRGREAMEWVRRYLYEPAKI